MRSDTTVPNEQILYKCYYCNVYSDARACWASFIIILEVGFEMMLEYIVSFCRTGDIFSL